MLLVISRTHSYVLPVSLLYHNSGSVGIGPLMSPVMPVSAVPPLIHPGHPSAINLLPMSEVSSAHTLSSVCVCVCVCVCVSVCVLVSHMYYHKLKLNVLWLGKGGIVDCSMKQYTCVTAVTSNKSAIMIGEQYITIQPCQNNMPLKCDQYCVYVGGTELKSCM